VISYIVATHNREILDANLGATLQLQGADELVVVEDAPSIAVAYNEGQAKATQPIRCYIHHDIQILKPQALRTQLLQWCVAPIGIVGVVGSRNRAVPWWEGAALGSVIDSRVGVQQFARGGEAAYLDGILLASPYELTWDEQYPGWHWYDHDISEQSLQAGRVNWCLSDGHELVRHNNRGSFDTTALPDWDTGRSIFIEKWGAGRAASRT
jgi:hypothetical protein